MDNRELIAVLLLLLAAAGWLAWRWVSRRLATRIVHDYETGLLYEKGSFIRVLETGRHRIWTPTQEIHLQDKRLRHLELNGQEVLTADNLTVKASAHIQYRIADARVFNEAAENPVALLYADLQIVLRRAIAALKLEEALAGRGEIARVMSDAIGERAAPLGLAIARMELRDLMLSGEAKRAYADIFRARKEGEAQLERARGETAALRNLANGARMLKDNPGLYNLRLLQTLATASAKGATVVINTAETVPGAALAEPARPGPADGEA
ncbi:MAG: slipin family protein [Hyphomicrobiaceae bacterium]